MPGGEEAQGGPWPKNSLVGQPVPLMPVNMYIVTLPKNILGEVTAQPCPVVLYIYFMYIFLVPYSLCTYLYIVPGTGDCLYIYLLHQATPPTAFFDRRLGTQRSPFN